MTAPHLCMVHEHVDDTSAIARHAMWATRVALEAGMRVTLVAAEVDRHLRDSVEVRPLWVPPRLHLVQWLAAGTTIRRALGDRTRYDLIHTHQPQAAPIADIWQVHFLARANVDDGGVPPPAGFADAVRWVQRRGVAVAEDRCIRRVPSSTEVLVPSRQMLGRYEALYGMPDRHAILPIPGPASRPAPDPARRAELRNSRGIPRDARVIGFLGGDDPRKGGDLLVDAVAEVADVHLWLAGSGADRLGDERLAGRLETADHLDRDDVSAFFETIDVLAVPSRFEPWGVVVNEAAAHGVPSIVAPGVGAGDDLADFGAGVVWDLQAATLPDILRRIFAEWAAFSRRARDFADRMSFEARAPDLLAVYQRVLEQKRKAPQDR